MSVNLETRIPSFVTKNSRLNLDCFYNLENTTSFLITWYKDNNPFYSFYSRNHLSKSFDVPGIHLDLLSSTHNSVVLTPINSSASGLYTCEVIRESPFFDILTDQSFMTVMELDLNKTDANPMMTSALITLAGTFAIIIVLLGILLRHAYPQALKCH
ncbi:hypothetical protein ABEB36_015799 [Hypothenemus hampei]|uniref:Ig-like domain-containing protein n=1 Tax=Hypothenemus hampei TaxID=57062 RepID=A0ABD1DZ08_HYPHA